MFSICTIKCRLALRFKVAVSGWLKCTQPEQCFYNTTKPPSLHFSENEPTLSFFPGILNCKRRKYFYIYSKYYMLVVNCCPRRQQIYIMNLLSKNVLVCCFLNDREKQKKCVCLCVLTLCCSIAAQLKYFLYCSVFVLFFFSTDKSFYQGPGVLRLFLAALFSSSGAFVGNSLCCC